MPQLEITTYYAQYLWLIVTFLSLYVAIAKYGLPAINRILRTRVHHISTLQMQVLSLVDNTTYLELFDKGFRVKLVREAVTALRKSMQEQTAWVSRSAALINQTTLCSVNQRYIDELYTLNLRIKHIRAMLRV